MADLNEVLESFLAFTQIPNFVAEMTSLSRINDSENLDEARLKDILILYLNGNKEERINPAILPPGDYDSTLILIDQVCQTVIDGIKKGLSLKDTMTLLTIFLEFLSAIKRYGSDSNADLYILTKKLQEIITKHLAKFNKHGLKLAVEYLTSIVLPNYHLYNYLLSEDQERDQTYEQLLINPIPPSIELSLGCPEDKWHRQQKLLKREAELEKGRAHIGYVHDKMILEKDQVGETCNKLLEELVDEGTGDESLGNVISMVTKMETDVVAKDLLLKVKQNEMEVDFALDKVNITVVPKKKPKN